MELGEGYAISGTATYENIDENFCHKRVEQKQRLAVIVDMYVLMSMLCFTMFVDYIYIKSVGCGTKKIGAVDVRVIDIYSLGIFFVLSPICCYSHFQKSRKRDYFFISAFTNVAIQILFAVCALQTGRENEYYVKLYVLLLCLILVHLYAIAKILYYRNTRQSSDI